MSAVDIIIPCYNYGRFLRECVESVTTQEDVEIRVLIIDDASKDNSADIAAQLASEDSRITFYRHPTNRGHIATYNEGLDWAASDYTVLLSADDMLAPGALSRSVRLMDANPRVGFTYGRTIRLTDGRPKQNVRAPIAEFEARIWNGRTWLEWVFRDRKRFIDSPEVVVRTRLWKECGGYRPELPHSADLELWLQFAARADVGEIDALQGYYRLHDTNMHYTLAPSTLRSLQHWNGAFQSFFATSSSRLPDPARLSAYAASSLAHVALNAAYAPADRSDVGHRPALVEFAAGVWPPSESMRGRFECGFSNGRVREPWAARRILGAYAYLWRRLFLDGGRTLRLALSGDLRGSAFEAGRSCAHASLILECWQTGITSQARRAPALAGTSVRFSEASLVNGPTGASAG